MRPADVGVIHLAMVNQRRLFNTLVNEWLDRLEKYIGR